MTWDTVVIGSGPGGLSAAVALARGGQKVLVLEQHTLPGGWSHSFTLEGHRFSPGVHYLGNLDTGGGLRRLYEGLGVAGELEFCELNPDGFDHFLIEGHRFDQPRGRQRWIDRLTAAFPHEREGLARYFQTLASVVKELSGAEELLRFPRVLTLPWKAAVVFGKLLPEKYCRAQLRKVRRMEYSVSSLSLFLAVEMDLEGLGYDSGNYWWYRTRDVDGIYRRAENALPESGFDGLFLAITSLKDPGHSPPGIHTLELFTFLPWDLFSRWSATSLGERGSEYQRLKHELADRALETAEQIIPGLRRHVRFLEVGTPLTNDAYCETHHGALYGTAKTPWQLGPFSFGQHGPLEGLHFCGSSTLSHGVAGAAMSGLMAAAPILGHSHFEQCLAPGNSTLRIVPADRPEPRRERPARVEPSPTIPFV